MPTNTVLAMDRKILEALQKKIKEGLSKADWVIALIYIDKETETEIKCK